MLQMTKRIIVIDHDAIVIGRLYAQGNQKRAEALRAYWECGRRLLAKKKALGHGNWLPWLRLNAETLNFSTDQTARMLMNFAKTNPKPALDLSNAEATLLNLKLWGRRHGLFAYCTGNFEWYTPQPIVEAARAVMGSIDLDPASCPIANKTVQAAKYFTKKDDGLKQEWSGNVFINPPFGNPLIRHFAEKLIVQYMQGITRQAVWVSNASVSSDWWSELLEKGIACFAHKRIKFYGPEAETQNNMLGQSIIYLGERRDSFCEAFAEIGVVMERVFYENA